jgi:hypothetical protein
VFAGGLGLFALASLAGGLAQSELALVGARAAQGLGGAMGAGIALAGALVSLFVVSPTRAVP